MKVDNKQVLNLLKQECIRCNVRYKYQNNKRCINCPFVISNDVTTGIKFKIIGVPHGLKKPYVYYFLNYPELNWKLPELPVEDLHSNFKKEYKRWNWELHHEDGDHFNDNYWNLMLLINTEHSRYHIIDKPLLSKEESRIKLSNTQKQQVKDGTHHFITNNPMYVPELKKKCGRGISIARKKEIAAGSHHFITNHPMHNPNNILKNIIVQNEMVKNGTHPFVGNNNPRINTIQHKNLFNWLMNIKIGDYKITNELASNFEYCNSYTLRIGLTQLIKRKNISNIQLIKNKPSWIIRKGE